MKTLCFAVALAFATVSSPLCAQAYDSNATIQSFSEASIEPVLTQLGAQITGRDKDGDRDRISIKFANGYDADIVIKACLDDGRCVGANIQARWDRDDYFSKQQDLEYTAWFNGNWDFTKSGLQDDGKLFIHRYVIADRGITQGTLYDELLNFQDMCRIFYEELDKRR